MLLVLPLRVPCAKFLCVGFVRGNHRAEHGLGGLDPSEKFGSVGVVAVDEGADGLPQVGDTGEDAAPQHTPLQLPNHVSTALSRDALVGVR